MHDLMRRITTAVQEPCHCHRRLSSRVDDGVDLQAKNPSSSSLRVCAGNGAPGPSLLVGSLTYPSFPKGFRACSLDKMGVDDVFAGMSASRLDQPIEFKESRKDVEAILADDLDGSAMSLRCSLSKASVFLSKCTNQVRKLVRSWRSGCLSRTWNVR